MLEAALRAAVYLVLIVCVRASGQRTLGQATTFELLVLLIIAEAVSPALTQGDDSLATACVLVFTLLGLNFLMSYLKFYSQTVDRVIDGAPIVLVRDGKMDHVAMRKVHVDQDDILEAARIEQGLTAIEEIGLATLERSGRISVTRIC